MPYPTRRPRRLVAGLLVSALLALAGCDDGADGAHASPARSVEGVYRTDGYGTAVVIRGHRLRTYETTAVSCAPGSLRGEQHGGTGPGGRRTYAVPDSAPVTVTPDGAGRARLRIADDAGSRTLRRTGRLPHRCGRRPARDPRAVFDVFWRTYAENYPFFEAKGVDWRAVRDRYRPQVTAHTSDAELFAILRKMIEPLHDAHTALSAGEHRRYAGMRQDTEPPTKKTLARIEKATAESVGVRQRRWAHGAISFAELPGMGKPLGYLRITRFEGYTGRDTYASDAAELDRALDAVFTAHRIRRLGGLVLDLRFNAGGADPLGLRLASRLTGHPYRAYAKRARNDPAHEGKFTRPEPIRVAPHHGPAYTGKLAVLTSRYTVSAGETAVQALTGRSPAPVRVGGNTQGAFSDTLDRTLPNGWQFSLPNEEFRARGGRTYDGTGIPPQHRTPVYTDEEFAHHRDSALAKARALLRGDRHRGH